MLAVDTNGLVRLLARDDAAQVHVAEAFISRGAWVSHLVLAETVWVLDSVYELSRAQIATAIEMLLNHKELSLQEADVVTAALALTDSKIHPRLLGTQSIPRRHCRCRCVGRSAHRIGRCPDP